MRSSAMTGSTLAGDGSIRAAETILGLRPSMRWANRVWCRLSLFSNQA